MNMTLGRDMREVPRYQWPFMPGIESVPIKVWLSWRRGTRLLQGKGLNMNATIETLETLRTPFADITPVVWRDGDMCGLASLRMVPTCPLARLLGAIARAM